jgi:hypothetical protein
MSRRDIFAKVLLAFTLMSTLANAQQGSSQLPVWNANPSDTRVAMPETDWVCSTTGDQTGTIARLRVATLNR